MDGADCHDRTSASLPDHLARRELTAMEDTEQSHVQRGAEVVIGQLEKRPMYAFRRVGDQDVQSIHSRHGRLEDLLQPLPIRDVAAQDEGDSSHRPHLDRHRFSLVEVVAIDDDHIGAAPRELQGTRPTDTAARSRHERHLRLECHGAS